MTLAAARAGGEREPSRLKLQADTDRDLVRRRLEALSELPEVAEAIFLASRPLALALQGWEPARSTPERQRLERSLLRYVARMSGRATPFALFGAWTPARVEGLAAPITDLRRVERRVTRVSLAALLGVAERIRNTPDLEPQLRYFPNASVYRLGNLLRWMERAGLSGEFRSKLVDAEVSEWVELARETCRPGLRRQQLEAQLALTLKEQANPAEISAFVAELIDAQLLVPDLEPPLSGPEPLDHLLQSARTLGAPHARALEEVAVLLKALDAQGPGAPVEAYRSLGQTLHSVGVDLEDPHLYRVELLRELPDARVPTEAARLLIKGATLLQRSAPARSLNGVAEALDDFRSAFLKRYESEEVPLLTALDPERGIGFGSRSPPPGSSVLAKLPFPGLRPSPVLDERDLRLLRHLQHLAVDARELVLSETEVAALGGESSKPLPDAFSVTGAMAIDPGSCAIEVIVHQVRGPSGARLLSRISESCASFRECLRVHLAEEEALQPEATFVEVVHLADAFRADGLRRPGLRPMEWGWLGKSGVPPERQLKAEDLTVQVVGGRVVLRSRSLGREVLPRMTTAVRPELHGLPLYQFLQALQEQGVAGMLEWSWGALEGSPFLPRVRSGAVVLSRACWNLDEGDARRLGALEGAALFCAVAELREARHLPRQVTVFEPPDQHLPLDLENILCVEVLGDLLRRNGGARLFEWFPRPEASWLGAPGAHFVHDLVVPVVRVGPVEPRPVPEGFTQGNEWTWFLRDDEPTRHSGTVHRRLGPGSDCLSLQLATGNRDELLRQLHPLIGSMKETGVLRSWFFIRYGDPDDHLRLRLFGAPEVLWGEGLPALHREFEPLVASGLINDFRVSTYVREVERYGGPGAMPLAESLFHGDSELALGLLFSGELPLADPLRWQLTAYRIELWMRQLGLTQTERLHLMERARDGFRVEHGYNPAMAQALSLQFRTHRTFFERVLEEPWSPEPEERPGVEQLLEFSKAMAPAIAGLKALEQSGQLTHRVSSTTWSYLHMSVNRLAESPRTLEWFLYEMFSKAYRSTLARKESGESPTP